MYVYTGFIYIYNTKIVSRNIIWYFNFLRIYTDIVILKLEKKKIPNGFKYVLLVSEYKYINYYTILFRVCLTQNFCTATNYLYEYLLNKLYSSVIKLTLGTEQCEQLLYL